jgi:thiamine biosynthesis lipoprotein
MTAPVTQSAMVHPRLGIDRELGTATWRALGTYVHLRVTDPDLVTAAAGMAADILDEVDRAYSRFREDSELMSLGGRPGVHTVSPILAGALRVALEAARETDGLVDPTLGSLLVASGYDRTFTLVPEADPTPVALPRTRPDWRLVDVVDDRVVLPEGVTIDLGATGKAFASDLVALTVAGRLDTGIVSSVGGDVRVVTADGTDTWPVSVAHSPSDLDKDRLIATVDLRDGGLATSSVTARRWTRGGRQWHHLLDPRTGLPASGPWATVTALGHTCAAANTASTAALVLGEAAYEWLVDHDVAALLATADGRTVRTPAWLASGVETTDHDHTHLDPRRTS